jgi:hypothetical protein
MNDFIVNVNIENIQPSIVSINNLPDTSNAFNVIVENLEANRLFIETSYVDSIGIIEIERFSSPSLEIFNQSSIIRVDDLPDIPFSKITGNLDVYRISNLDQYLNSYSFDCGTP